MNVKDRQCLLTFLKKADGTSYYTGEVDGIYGRLSRKAIQEFQQDFCGLTVTGESDAVTDQAMIHAVAFGIPERDPDADPDVTDNNVGVKEETTGSFWDEIEYFDRDEFKCKCGGKYCNGYPSEPDERMVIIANQLRKNLGVPVTIVSGLRCKTWNAIQGGVTNSQHMYGEAADIYARGVPQARVEAELDKIGGVRYHYAIAGSNNVHFDVPKGNR
jgi:peptidoglycan hydrolase-like protein with peptidoglycan-binding domain